MSDAKLMVEALREHVATYTYRHPLAFYAQLADIIDRKLAEREAEACVAWEKYGTESRGRESAGEPGADTRAEEPGISVATEPGSRPGPSDLDELRAKYEAEIEVEGYLVAAHNFIVTLEAKVKRLQYRGGMRDVENLALRKRAEQAERERDEARALIAEYEREPGRWTQE